MVNPLLQAYCVRCHDGNYQGSFQLVPTKIRSEQTQDALRVNLDATLRLVDQENLARSELLTATLRPHGNGPRKRPIFPGSNDRAYQILSTWVQSLRSPKDMREAARSQPGRAQPDDGETFAAGRGRIGNENQDDDLTSLSSGGRAPLPGTPASPRIPRPTPFPAGPGMKPEGSTPGVPDDFPLPFAITGGSQISLLPRPLPAPAHDRRDPATQQPLRCPRADARKPGSSPDGTGSGDPSTATKKKAKPVKLDPARSSNAASSSETAVNDPT